MKYLAVLLAFFVLPLQAATLNLTWTNPTTNSDGSALALSAITATRLEYGSCVGTAFGTKAGEWTQTGNVAASVSPNLTPGTYCFRAYTRVGALESVASNVATKTISQPPPSPPTNLVADPGNLVAYGISQTPDKLTTFPVGTVMAGVVCDSGTTLNGLYKVPRGSVAWAGNVMPAVVFANCTPG
jgi:hypothetical protein